MYGYNSEVVNSMLEAIAANDEKSVAAKQQACISAINNGLNNDQDSAEFKASEFARGLAWMYLSDDECLNINFSSYRNNARMLKDYLNEV